MTRLPKANWPAIRHEFETIPQSIAALSRKYRVVNSTIYAKARQEKWTRAIDPNRKPSAISQLPTIEVVGERDSALDLAADDSQSPAVSELTASDAISAQELPLEELQSMQRRVVSGHRVSVGKDMALLDRICNEVGNSKRMTAIQRLNALDTIAKIRGKLIELERKAWKVPDEVEIQRPAVAVQVNVNLAPADAYLEMIGKGKAG